MEDPEFRELFHRLIDQYALEPDIAEELLQRILDLLSHNNPAEEYS